MRDRLLYVTVNDGSDTRVAKELKLFSKEFDVYLIRFARKDSPDYRVVKDYRLMNGYKTLIGLLSIWFKVLLVTIRFRFRVVHVVDEECLLLLWLPLLFVRGHLRVDIFDSWFLKKNQGSDDALLFRRILYCKVNSVIVTDDNRKRLLPGFLANRAIVVPNVPIKSECNFGIKKLELLDSLTVAFVGSLSKDRGVHILERILQCDDRINVVCMGWIYDEYTRIWIDTNSDRVSFLGQKSQEECNKYVHENAHYLFCYYKGDNLNNINASPNKIYDSIHTSTPCLINSVPTVSRWVRDMNIGLVYEENAVLETVSAMFVNYASFFNKDLIKDEYTWDYFESILIQIKEK